MQKELDVLLTVLHVGKIHGRKATLINSALLW